MTLDEANARRRAKRARAGAVMVEAALVVPLLVVFYGFNVFFHKAYQAKIRLRAEARESAFSAAIRGCPSGSSSTESSLSSGATGQVGEIGAKKGDGTSSVMSFTHGSARASKSATVSWRTAYGPWSATLKPADSYVYCNEKGANTNASSWYSWGAREVRNQ